MEEEEEVTEKKEETKKEIEMKGFKRRNQAIYAEENDE